jgi:S1-C subfamily serine protease
MATAVDEIATSVASIAQNVGKSVVGIGDRWSRGSGLVLENDRVLTNAHNLRGGEASVIFDDGRTAEARVLGVDADGDLAVLAVDTGGASPFEWSAQVGSLAIGSPVFAVANPGGHGLRVTFGMISGLERTFRGPRGRRIAGSVEHTAPLLPGSSGGPIVDAEGKLLGLNTNRLGEGFYLAIPADAALRRRIDALARGESPARPRLGVAIAPGHVARRLRRSVGLPEADGVLVRGVEDDSPAARAGISEGDLIVGVGDGTVAGVDDLYEALAAGGTLALKVLRGAEEKTLTVSLEQGKG